MDDFWPIVLIGILIVFLVVMVVSVTGQTKQQIELKEARQSAQIKTVCDRDYKDKSYKDVPVKCLDFWGFTKKQEGK